MSFGGSMVFLSKIPVLKIKALPSEIIQQITTLATHLSLRNTPPCVIHETLKNATAWRSKSTPPMPISPKIEMPRRSFSPQPYLTSLRTFVEDAHLLNVCKKFAVQQAEAPCTPSPTVSSVNAKPKPLVAYRVSHKCRRYRSFWKALSDKFKLRKKGKNGEVGIPNIKMKIVSDGSGKTQMDANPVHIPKQGRVTPKAGDYSACGQKKPFCLKVPPPATCPNKSGKPDPKAQNARCKSADRPKREKEKIIPFRMLEARNIKIPKSPERPRPKITIKDLGCLANAPEKKVGYFDSCPKIQTLPRHPVVTRQGPCKCIDPGRPCRSLPPPCPLQKEPDIEVCTPPPCPPCPAEPPVGKTQPHPCPGSPCPCPPEPTSPYPSAAKPGPHSQSRIPKPFRPRSAPSPPPSMGLPDVPVPTLEITKCLSKPDPCDPGLRHRPTCPPRLPEPRPPCPSCRPCSCCQPPCRGPCCKPPPSPPLCPEPTRPCPKACPVCSPPPCPPCSKPCDPCDQPQWPPRVKEPKQGRTCESTFSEEVPSMPCIPAIPPCPPSCPPPPRFPPCTKADGLPSPSRPKRRRRMPSPYSVDPCKPPCPCEPPPSPCPKLPCPSFPLAKAPPCDPCPKPRPSPDPCAPSRRNAAPPVPPPKPYKRQNVKPPCPPPCCPPSCCRMPPPASPWPPSSKVYKSEPVPKVRSTARDYPARRCEPEPQFKPYHAPEPQATRTPATHIRAEEKLDETKMKPIRAPPRVKEKAVEAKTEPVLAPPRAEEKIEETKTEPTRAPPKMTGKTIGAKTTPILTPPKTEEKVTNVRNPKGGWKQERSSRYMARRKKRFRFVSQKPTDPSKKSYSTFAGDSNWYATAPQPPSKRDWRQEPKGSGETVRPHQESKCALGPRTENPKPTRFGTYNPLVAVYKRYMSSSSLTRNVSCPGLTEQSVTQCVERSIIKKTLGLQNMLLPLRLEQENSKNDVQQRSLQENPKEGTEVNEITSLLPLLAEFNNSLLKINTLRKLMIKKKQILEQSIPQAEEVTKMIEMILDETPLFNIAHRDPRRSLPVREPLRHEEIFDPAIYQERVDPTEPDKFYIEVPINKEAKLARRRRGLENPYLDGTASEICHCPRDKCEMPERPKSADPTCNVKDPSKAEKPEKVGPTPLESCAPPCRYRAKKPPSPCSRGLPRILEDECGKHRGEPSDKPKQRRPCRSSCRVKPDVPTCDKCKGYEQEPDLVVKPQPSRKNSSEFGTCPNPETSDCYKELPPRSPTCSHRTDKARRARSGPSATEPEPIPPLNKSEPCAKNERSGAYNSTYTKWPLVPQPVVERPVGPIIKQKDLAQRCPEQKPAKPPPDLVHQEWSAVSIKGEKGEKKTKLSQVAKESIYERCKAMIIKLATKPPLQKNDCPENTKKSDKSEKSKTGGSKIKMAAPNTTALDLPFPVFTIPLIHHPALLPGQNDDGGLPRTKWPYQPCWNCQTATRRPTSQPVSRREYTCYFRLNKCTK